LTFKRPGLAALLDQARPNDTLAVIRLDRLGRSLKELLETVDDLKAREINLINARKHGRTPGRPPLQPETISALQDLIGAGKSVAQAAKHLGIGRSTAYKAIRNATP